VPAVDTEVVRGDRRSLTACCSHNTNSRASAGLACTHSTSTANRNLLCTCQASGCESVGSCWLSVTAYAAGPGASAKTCGWTTAITATFPEAVRETEEVVPVNVSTWVLSSGVTVGR
jgi:hypothetical protein